MTETSVRRADRLAARVRGARLGWRAVAVALVLVAAGTWEDFPGDRRYHNRERVPGAVLSATGIVGGAVVTGTPQIVGLVDFSPHVPMTILGVRPLSVDPGIELLAVRAVVGFGEGRSPGGYRRLGGSVLQLCAEPTTPITGWGPTYPPTGMRLQPGDNLSLLFYFRTTRPGPRFVTGYRIAYHTATGTHVVTGDTSRAEAYASLPGQPRYPGVSECGRDGRETWLSRYPGFPA